MAEFAKDGTMSGHTSCAVYARVSTVKQATENSSIEVQLAEGRKYAEAHGWIIYREYADRGASGTSDKGRPQFAAMLDEALKPDPPFTMILVYDHSRFYRNVGQSELTRLDLQLNGVQVQSITQPIEDDGLSGSLVITIQAAVDQQHSRMTAMKVRAGMAASAREGFNVGGNVPYGYRLEDVERRGTKIKKKLAIDPAEAQTVKHIFDLYVSGLGITAITIKLNGDGFRSRKGKLWFRSMVGKMLSTETYVGRFTFKPTHWRTKKPLHRSEWIVIPCPPIIDEPQFQNVQRLLKERDPRNTPGGYTTSDVLLGKIARCGSCGGSLHSSGGTGQNKTAYRYYKCAARVQKGFCPGGAPISINRDVLDDIVLQRLADELLTATRVQEIVTRAAEMQASSRETTSVRIKHLKQQLTAARRREGNMWDLAADLGIKARSGFLGKVDALNDEIASLERQIAAGETLLASAVRRLTPFEATEKATKMRQLLFTADIMRKRRFVRAVVDKVIVREDGIEIVGKESNLAEVANDVDIRVGPPVQSFDREWCRLQDSNL